ncbi:uncharacterized protein TNIN_425261 [Trichonephila inaurata madagascariensis]|uniref:Uncharacterized protein n=1 Tax=Trichonephila inaurata madagascariensis TaxID=2747483 RepID=A0A8X6XGS2_9ARAC|nr:uncharacterized protein TNIN_425261 [Trichonephila inaurata madagascariensis]
MRCIGKGAESARMFCGFMNLPRPPIKFSKYNNILLRATRQTCEDSMAEAVSEAVDENDGKRDLAVAVDGSWQKRAIPWWLGIPLSRCEEPPEWLKLRRLKESNKVVIREIALGKGEELFSCVNRAVRSTIRLKRNVAEAEINDWLLRWAKIGFSSITRTILEERK